MLIPSTAHDFPQTIAVANEWLGAEGMYISLIIVLFIVPRIFLRFGIPIALSTFALGVAATAKLGFFGEDPVINLFSFLGITSLFLFAGLEVELPILRSNAKSIAVHITVKLVMLALFSWLAQNYFSLPFTTSAILALAIVTPSAGFILHSLAGSSISDAQKFWVRLKAIASELVALTLLLVLVQGESFLQLAISVSILVVAIATLPYLLRKIAYALERFAPGSEFNFLIILAFIFALITKKMGAYYLVGAFAVGMAAARFRKDSTDLSTDEMMKSIRQFALFFMPFYFLNAGLNLSLAVFSLEALYIGLAFVVITIPIRVATTLLHRKISLGESWRESYPVAISLLPNLVFGLVLADILRARFHAPAEIVGGVIIFTFITTITPGFLLRFVDKHEDLAELYSYDHLFIKNPPDPPT